MFEMYTLMYTVASLPPPNNGLQLTRPALQRGDACGTQPGVCVLHATESERANWKISGGGYGIHWPALDEDLSSEGLLRGAPAPAYRKQGAA
jgi:hypothetical protein